MLRHVWNASFYSLQEMQLEKSDGAISNYPHLTSAFSQRSTVRLGPIVYNTKGAARCSYDQGHCLEFRLAEAERNVHKFFTKHPEGICSHSTIGVGKRCL